MTTNWLTGATTRPRDTDRNAILVLIGLIWTGVLMGFGGQILSQPDRVYLPIVHVHAFVFVGWLVLLTVQALLARRGRVDLHRRLGLVGAALACIMVILGPATAIMVDAAKFAAKGRAPAFLAVQLSDMVAFTLLVGAGLVMRARPQAHKRLILMGTLYISDAGFSRWLGDAAEALVGGGQGFTPTWASLYLPNVVLVLAFGAYELAAHRRLHPAYLAAAGLTFSLQIMATALLLSPAWASFSLKLIGH
ncbi:hypothetical protein [Phenylobacterium sp.]|uniref:hypothetical protein n=1 Tax=Phenylobacterium sp. TaxID=1871053 RepID=UPI0035B31A5F